MAVLSVAEGKTEAVDNVHETTEEPKKSSLGRVWTSFKKDLMGYFEEYA
jgi:hypothetical protein